MEDMTNPQQHTVVATDTAEDAGPDACIQCKDGIQGQLADCDDAILYTGAQPVHLEDLQLQQLSLDPKATEHKPEPLPNDQQEEESPPSNTVTMRPTEVISSRGHQLLTLHNNDEDRLHADMDIEDITVGLPEVPPIWDEAVDSWYSYGEDYRPALDCYEDGLPTVFDDMTSVPIDLHMQWMSDNSMQLAAVRDSADWHFDPDLYRSYNLRYGPFDVDACADNEG